MVRLLSDFGIMLLVARQVMRGMLPHEVIRLVLIGTSIAVAGAVVEYATTIQIYQALTGFPINQIPGRVRGLNFEPRGLGLTMVQGGFIAFLWWRHRRSRVALALALAHLLVLVLAVSASALVTAAFGWLCLLVFERKARVPLLGFGALGASAAALALMLGKNLPLAASWTTNLTQRFTIGQAVDLATRTPVEVLARFLDIFDYTAFMVLTSSPLAALIGVGPGLVILPGSNYIPSDLKWSWVVNTNEGITSPPTMGILVEWSNGGIPMLLVWLAFAVACSRALSAMADIDPEHGDSWRLGRGAFVVMAGMYLVQASPISAIWPIFMGLGLGAAALRLRSAPTWETSRMVAAEGIA
jgi:hypothetical protein